MFKETPFKPSWVEAQPVAWSEWPRSGSLGTWLSPDGSAFGERGRPRPRRSRIGEPRTTETGDATIPQEIRLGEAKRQQHREKCFSRAKHSPVSTNKARGRRACCYLIQPPRWALKNPAAILSIAMCKEGDRQKGWEIILDHGILMAP